MEQVKQFTIEDVTYTMTPANAMAAWTALKNAMKLLQSVDLSALGDSKKVLYIARIKICLFNSRSSFFPRGNSGIKSNGAKQRCY